MGASAFEFVVRDVTSDAVAVPSASIPAAKPQSSIRSHAFIVASFGWIERAPQNRARATLKPT
jgi:hypothetical protein